MINVAKTKIKNSHGFDYIEFKRTLRPNYFSVWLQILTGYLVIIAVFVVLKILKDQGLDLWGMLAAAVFAGLVAGYARYFIHLFFHEGSHFGLAEKKSKNDFLCNLFIGIFVGQQIDDYRKIHFDHHRFLGTTQDTETNYYHSPDLNFFLNSFFGINVVRFLRRTNANNKKFLPQTKAAKKLKTKIFFFLGLLLNIAILYFFSRAGYWEISLAWALAALMFLPFFTSVRQLVEHRRLDAGTRTDFDQIPHGEVNRMFGSGLVASTFGGAGFNRHLLHHWEPQISCTNLAVVENFLMDTEVAPLIEEARTTYFETLTELIRSTKSTGAL